MNEDQYRWHETPENKRKEFAVLLAFTGMQRLCALTTPDGECFDATLIRYPNPIALAEIKCRNHAFGTFKTYTIDAAKIDDIKVRAYALGVPIVLIVSWLGDVRYVVIQQHHLFRASVQQRSDRDEYPDPVYHIPIDRFVAAHYPLPDGPTNRGRLRGQ